jgi:sulfur relay (sulfurtransferase) DsrF/TusC family protein
MVPEKVTLKTGYEWKKLNASEKPTYRSEIKQATAGATKEETVTAVTKYDPEALLKKFSNFPVVLRMKTDNSVFFVGSGQYPVVTEVSDDKVNDNYSFKCKSVP